MIDNDLPKVLHLARWYPNKYDSMLGLFVKRHAEAVGLFCPSYVLFVQPVVDLHSSFDFSVENTGNLIEIRVFYRDFKWNIPVISPVFKGVRFLLAAHKGLTFLRNNNLHFNFIHVHVLTRLGLIALFYKLFFKIPYGITEHWSRYLPATNGFHGRLRKFFTRIIVKYASFVSTVTYNLQQAMIAHQLINNQYFVLPNVINPNLKFSLPKTKNPLFTFIHISTFEDRSKNISGIIRVLSQLVKMRQDFQFVFVGDGQDYQKMIDLATSLIGNNNQVSFVGLVDNENLGEILTGADAMVVFSNYENFPVVINESLFFGIPVLSTAVGGIPEVINNENGILIEPGNEKQLLAEMCRFIDGHYGFDSAKIRLDFSEKYSAENIGKLLLSKYLMFK